MKINRNAGMPFAAIKAALLQEGWVAAHIRDIEGLPRGTDPSAFLSSWDHLPRDTYMGDGGRYRRRRYAVYEIDDGEVVRLPGEPHYQSRQFNALNGGRARQFAPVETDFKGRAFLSSLIVTLYKLVSSAAEKSWRVEVHQFRITARDGERGLPTPEGLHRDGVDWVMIVMINRANVIGGEISLVNSEMILSLPFTEPQEFVIVNDHTWMHEVSAIHQLDFSRDGYRDTLVFTMKRLT